jgi:hypothetical protein
VVPLRREQRPIGYDKSLFVEPELKEAENGATIARDHSESLRGPDMDLGLSMRAASDRSLAKRQELAIKAKHSGATTRLTRFVLA